MVSARPSRSAPSTSRGLHQRAKAFGQRVLRIPEHAFQFGECGAKCRSAGRIGLGAAAACGRRTHAVGGGRVRSSGTPKPSGKSLDAALQLHGGAGYMNEYPIAKLWRDGRVSGLRRQLRNHDGSGQPDPLSRLAPVKTTKATIMFEPPNLREFNVEMPRAGWLTCVRCGRRVDERVLQRRILELGRFEAWLEAATSPAWSSARRSPPSAPGPTSPNWAWPTT